ncbi:MAG TPA: lipopolysaccharide assembly protein LapA domain-containing protein [Gemmatimonadota bacterium]|nr:lipopolysaccharide assembly protein LapA domain-containing protein [Gemmatimonadota bacterium]
MGGGSRRWALVAGIAASLLLVPFAVFNRGQTIALDFGIWTWRGEAVYAVYAGIFVGLLVMFLLGLPADLAARGERQRLARRVRELERERDLAGTARHGDRTLPPGGGEVRGGDPARTRE